MQARGKVCEPKRAKWDVAGIPCNKQEDGHSCGVFLLMVRVTVFNE